MCGCVCKLDPSPDVGTLHTRSTQHPASNFQLGVCRAPTRPQNSPQNGFPFAIPPLAILGCGFGFAICVLVKCCARNCTPTQPDLGLCPHPHPHPKTQSPPTPFPTPTPNSGRVLSSCQFLWGLELLQSPANRFVFTWFLHINTNIHIQINKVYTWVD